MPPPDDHSDAPVARSEPSAEPDESSASSKLDYDQNNPNENQNQVPDQIGLRLSDYEKVKQLDSDIYVANGKFITSSEGINIYSITSTCSPSTSSANLKEKDKDLKNKNNIYVIKILNLESSDDIDLKLTINDIQTCKQLKHPNIL